MASSTTACLPWASQSTALKMQACLIPYQLTPGVASFLGLQQAGLCITDPSRCCSGPELRAWLSSHFRPAPAPRPGARTPRQGYPAGVPAGSWWCSPGFVSSHHCSKSSCALTYLPNYHLSLTLCPGELSPPVPQRKPENTEFFPN